MSWTIHQGDALTVMATLPDNSVDLVVTDPPYFRVKGEWWDRQWDTAAGFLNWIGRLCGEWQRILKPNGSLYVFASPRMAARVEVKIGETFNVLNRIRWVKDAGWHKKTDEAMLRSYLSPWEEIIFAEHYGADGYAKGEAGYAAQCDDLRGFVFEPLRLYLRGEWERAGLKPEQANEACGTASMAGRHYFSRSQWCLPTAEHYASLQRYANRNGGDYLRREYDDLRREYEDLRRPFSVTDDVPYTDVWDFPTVKPYKGKHPCEKPVVMLEHIIRASSKPGGVALDCFMGSGATGEAALRLGRQFVGVEIDGAWCDRAKWRLHRVERAETPTSQSAMPGMVQLALMEAAS